MKYFVITTSSLIQCEDETDALNTLSDTENSIIAVKCESEEDAYSEDREIIAERLYDEEII